MISKFPEHAHNIVRVSVIRIACRKCNISAIRKRLSLILVFIGLQGSLICFFPPAFDALILLSSFNSTVIDTQGLSTYDINLNVEGGFIESLCRG